MGVLTLDTVDFSKLKHHNSYEFVCSKCGKTSSKIGRALKKSHQLICHSCLISKIQDQKFGCKSPPFIKSLDDIGRILRHTSYTFVCEKCNQTVSCLGSYLLKKQQLLCKKCQTQLTNYQKYGVPISSQNEKVREKQKNTFAHKSDQEKLQSYQKREITLLQRYGATNPMHNSFLKEKCHKSLKSTLSKKLIEKYQSKDFTPYGMSFSVENDEPILTCLKCGTKKYLKIPSDRVLRCFNCLPVNSTYSSSIEFTVFNTLKKWIPDLIARDKSIIGPKELDMYSPSCKLAIEINGLYWHSELSSSICHKEPYFYKNRHRQKWEMCKEKGITLIQIWDSEWLDPRVRPIILEIIRAKIGMFDRKIFARKCTTQEVPSKQAMEFLDDNHIQGRVGTTVRVGLFEKNQLVGLQCFERIKDQNWNLVRTVFQKGVQVIGGTGKMLSYFEKTYCPKKLVDYTDLRFFDGRGHHAMGLIAEKITPPCVYYTDGIQILHRKNFWDKTNKDLTTWENAQLKGFGRIWDCGKIVHVKTYF